MSLSYEKFYGPDNMLILSRSSTTTDGIMRIGTSSSRKALGTTAGREGVRFNFSSTATSGTARGLDVRLTQSGAAGEADCFRALQTVDCNTTTCRGAHISLSFTATAGASECSGLGTPLNCTLHIPNVASWAPTGTLYGALIEVYSDGTASDPAGLTELSLLCLSNSGNATGALDVDTDAYILSIQGFTAASGVTNAISSTRLAELPASTVGIRIKIGSTMYYVPAVISTEWN